MSTYLSTAITTHKGTIPAACPQVWTGLDRGSDPVPIQSNNITVQHHYIPNSRLYASNFTEDNTRIQLGSYLWASAEIKGGDLVLNNVATIVEANIPVTNGLVHMSDRILAGDAMIYEADIGTTKQGFIPGSCSNPDLPYC
ncbi:Retrovirus-related Pol polyprotein from transposon TNT 1-94 [Fusarium oxysporum f. sp. albedinis]|nr:Retrovirus-related Pol polyprotein from transposon TNT 1-94 [Fusarium oxysporum f. sp. albedinis]